MNRIISENRENSAFYKMSISFSFELIIQLIYDNVKIK